MQEPYNYVYMNLCGHGYQFGTHESWMGITDTYFTNQLNDKSFMFITMDTCFSDGMITWENLDKDKNIIFLSAA